MSGTIVGVARTKRTEPSAKAQVIGRWDPASEILRNKSPLMMRRGPGVLS